MINPTSALKTVAEIATICVPLIAIWAIFLTKRQIKESARTAQRATAYQIYHKYLLLAMEHPTLAYPRSEKITADRKLFETYRWFVSSMLLSFEEILEACPDEKDWERTIMDQLVRHKLHLKRSHSAKHHWKPNLQAMIEKAVESEFGTRDAPLLPKTITFICAQ